MGRWRDGTRLMGRDRTGQDGTGRDGTGRDETRRDETRRDETRRDGTRRDETRRDADGGGYRSGGASGRVGLSAGHGPPNRTRTGSTGRPLSDDEHWRVDAGRVTQMARDVRRALISADSFCDEGLYVMCCFVIVLRNYVLEHIASVLKKVRRKRAIMLNIGRDG